MFGVRSISRKTTLAGLIALALPVLVGTVVGHDYVPGAEQKHPILLKGGDLYTVSGGVLEQTDLLFENAKITQIGRNLAAPQGAEVIDVTGQNVYPGLIAANTSLGLIEVDAVRATDDKAEVGNVTPEVNTWIAYNPDSELLPSVRATGVTTVQVVPGGGLLRGQSSIMNTDGWTREDAAVKVGDGMFLSWPRASVITAWWMNQSAEEQKKQIAEQRKRIRKIFDDARAYMLARESDPDTEIDLRWDAMIPVLKKTTPLFVAASDFRQIEEAVHFAREQDLKLVIVGGEDAWRVAELLKTNNVPVVLNGTLRTPPHQDSHYDEPYKEPFLLQQAGIHYCIVAPGFGSAASWVVRNLPFQAGVAVSFGLTKEQALRAITLSPAEILGIADRQGSLDVGKVATIVVSDGDIMDHLTHNVTQMWIEGRAVDLNNRHKELFEKYMAKPVPSAAANR